MPQLWSAIGVTFLASTGNNVGKVSFYQDLLNFVFVAAVLPSRSDAELLNVMLFMMQVLQKDATRHLPRFAFHAKTAQQYLASRAWMLGLGLDVAGALLMIAAYAMAPVSMLDFRQKPTQGYQNWLMLP